MEVFWPEDQKFYSGRVVQFDRAKNTHTILYEDGEVETLDLAEERFQLPKPLPKIRGARRIAPWAAHLRIHMNNLLEDADAKDVEAVSALMSTSLAEETYRNYDKKTKEFFKFCRLKQQCPLPASKATGMLYVLYLKEKGTVSAESFQPYFSAVNTLHVELGFEPPLVGELITRLRRGVQYSQVPDEDKSRRLWLPAKHALAMLRYAEDMKISSTSSKEELEIFRALTYTATQFAWFSRSDTTTALRNGDIDIDDSITLLAVSQKGRKANKWKPVYRIPKDAVPQLEKVLQKFKALKKLEKDKLAGLPFWRLPHEDHKESRMAAGLGDEFLKLSLSTLGISAPAGFSYTGHSTRSGAATESNALGVSLTTICFWGDWSSKSHTVQDYIDPSCPPSPEARVFFGWMLPHIGISLNGNPS